MIENYFIREKFLDGLKHVEWPAEVLRRLIRLSRHLGLRLTDDNTQVSRRGPIGSGEASASVRSNRILNGSDAHEHQLYEAPSR